MNTIVRYQCLTFGHNVYHNLRQCFQHKNVVEMLAYRQKNFRCSDMYKVFHEEVPYYLHNRPMSIVQHCLRAHEAASTYCMDDITMTGSHKFEVRSEQNQGTWYKVDFGSSDRQPSCQCWSFRSSYLPCKHFFAIFRNTTMSWVDLAHRYQDSPSMNLDVIQHCHVSVPPANGGDDTVNDDSGHQQSMRARVERAEEEGIQYAQKKLREARKQVEDASFLCAVTETVQKSTEMMKQILNNLLTGAVTENRLYERKTEAETSQATAKYPAATTKRDPGTEWKQVLTNIIHYNALV